MYAHSSNNVFLHFFVRVSSTKLDQILHNNNSSLLRFGNAEWRNTEIHKHVCFTLFRNKQLRTVIDLKEIRSTYIVLSETKIGQFLLRAVA